MSCDHKKLKDFTIKYDDKAQSMTLNCPHCKARLAKIDGKEVKLTDLLAIFYYSLREGK